MRLCSIINIWECTEEFLPYVINNHLQFCDGIVLVASLTSNRMNECTPEWKQTLDKYAYHPYVHLEFCEPQKGLHVQVNETRKRNRGISKARELGYTHFFLADADEFYDADEVDTAKELFNEQRLNGLVASTRVYIKTPTLWCHDETLVSFIHALKPETYCGSFREYPFAYENGNARIDPTRRINVTRGVVKCDVVMRHMSYVRKNIDMKIANSSANLKRSESYIKFDLENAAPGYMVTFGYNQKLQESINEFNISI